MVALPPGPAVAQVPYGFCTAAEGSRIGTVVLEVIGVRERIVTADVGTVACILKGVEEDADAPSEMTSFGVASYANPKRGEKLDFCVCSTPLPY